MLDTKKIGTNLKTLRMENGLTQDMVAEKLFVTRQAVSSWEQGNSLPTIDSCLMLLEVYNTDLETLLCLEKRIGKEDAE